MSKIQRAGKYSTIPNILVKQHQISLKLQDLFHRELKEGNSMHEYLRVIRAQTAQRFRALAQARHGRQQNNKSELRLIAEIPLQDYWNWKQKDPNFARDNGNLKSLKRDNPDALVYI